MKLHLYTCDFLTHRAGWTSPNLPPPPPPYFFKLKFKKLYIEIICTELAFILLAQNVITLPRDNVT